MAKGTAKIDRVLDKLSEHDKRFDQITQRLDKHDENFRQINGKLDQHDDNFKQIAKTLDQHGLKFGAIEQTITVKFDQVLTGLDKISGELEKVREDQLFAQTKDGEFDKRLKVLEEAKI